MQRTRPGQNGASPLISVFCGPRWSREATTVLRGYNLEMGPAKAQLIQLIQDQPDDSSPEEILRELAFALMVERGIADSDAGRTISNEEMGRRIESWRR